MLSSLVLSLRMLSLAQKPVLSIMTIQRLPRIPAGNTFNYTTARLHTNKLQRLPNRVYP